MAKKAKKTKAAPEPQGGWKGKLLEAWQKFGNALESSAAKLSWKRPSLWLAGFFHPEETYGKEGGHATLPELFGNLLIFYFVYSAIFFAVLVAVTSLVPQAEADLMGFRKPENILWTGISLMVANTAVSALGAIAMFAFIYIAAKALGGKGDYVKPSYFLSLVLCGENVILLLFALAGLILLAPTYLVKGVLILDLIFMLGAVVIGIPLLLFCLAIILYSIYAYYIVVKKAHELSSWKAVGSIVVGMALVWLVNTVLEILTKSV